MLARSVLAALLVATVVLAEIPSNADEITSLPGLEAPLSFRQFSGYITVADPIPNRTRYLHYWLLLSQGSPDRDPLVLWMNGGPGCSSLLGLFTEHGPFRTTANGSLAMNPYSWNRAANMLYLEQPSGVGFSYGGNLTSGDDLAAHDNLEFLVGFFTLYPSLLANPFFIAGESYAGQYVPQLAARVLDHNEQGIWPHISLRGFLAGNPSGLWTSDYAYSYYAFMRQHAIISPEDYENIGIACNLTSSAPHKAHAAAANCSTAELDVYRRCIHGVDPYNVLAPCVGNGPGDTPGCAPRLGSAPLAHGKGSAERAQGQTFVPCGDYNTTLEYLNSAAVRAAIHVSPLAGAWTVCSQTLSYTQYRSDTPALYHRMIGSLAVLVYSGDLDSCVPFLTTQRAVAQLGYPLRAPFRQWTIHDDITKLTQIAGYVQEYATSGAPFVYATIRGAGHMVPTDRPQQALEMFARFINGQPL